MFCELDFLLPNDICLLLLLFLFFLSNCGNLPLDFECLKSDLFNFVLVQI